MASNKHKTRLVDRCHSHLLSERNIRLACVFILAVSVLTVYWQASEHDFVNFDDHAYVYKVPEVLDGLTWDGVIWAFSYPKVNCPHPLVYVSLMFDTSLYGPYPAGYILTNVLFHAVTTILLFLWLTSITRATFNSFVIAAIFAVHPTHAESVAWISERKDVLSLFFTVLTLMGYSSWQGHRRPWTYIPLILLPYSAALLSKPSVVVLPCILMLIDFWPFGTTRPAEGLSVWAWWKDLIMRTVARLSDKMPLFAGSLIFAALTWSLTSAYSGVISTDALPYVHRAIYALGAFTHYLQSFFVPGIFQGLSPLEIHPAELPEAFTSVSRAGFLGAITLLALVTARTSPWILVGWLWFAGSLIPVSGLFQNGIQLTANRYTYFPYIGLAIMIVFSFANIARQRCPQPAQFALSGVAVVWLLWLGWVAYSAAVPMFKNSETLWRAAIGADPLNERALAILSLTLSRPPFDRAGEAIVFAREAERLTDPSGRELSPTKGWRYSGSRQNAMKATVVALAKTERFEELETFLRRYPRFGMEGIAALEAGRHLAGQNRLDEALKHLKPLSLSDDAIYGLFYGALLNQSGRKDEAIDHLIRWRDIHPNDNLGASLLLATLASVGSDSNKEAEAMQEATGECFRIIEEAQNQGERLAAAVALSYALAKAGDKESAVSIVSRFQSNNLSSQFQEALDRWAAELEMPGELAFPEILIIQGSLLGEEQVIYGG